jgi:predicted dehydrogenase
MIRQARAMVAAGEIGAVRAVQAEYLAAGLASHVESDPNAPRRWKLEGTRGGPSLVLGDVGTHAFHLASYVLGAAPVRLSAELGASFPDRRVDDYAALRLAWADGARGTLIAMQSASGLENHILLRVIGEKSSLEWRHRAHNELLVMPISAPAYTLTRSQPWLAEPARQAARIVRPGHPEGFHEGFANLYRDAAEAMRARRAGEPVGEVWFPTVLDGARGVRMIEAAVESHAAGGGWVDCAVA